MKIISVNVNGIRAATNKGLIAWLEAEQADVVCIQETKAQVDQLDPAVHVPQGYHAVFCDAERKGYSGTAVFSRRKPDAVVNSLGLPEFDAEGRYLEARVGDVRVASLYLPSGSSGPERQAASGQRSPPTWQRHRAARSTCSISRRRPIATIRISRRSATTRTV